MFWEDFGALWDRRISSIQYSQYFKVAYFGLIIGIAYKKKWNCFVLIKFASFMFRFIVHSEQGHQICMYVVECTNSSHFQKRGWLVLTGSVQGMGRWETGPLMLPLSLPRLLGDITLHVWWLIGPQEHVILCFKWGRDFLGTKEAASDECKAWAPLRLQTHTVRVRPLRWIMVHTTVVQFVLCWVKMGESSLWPR